MIILLLYDYRSLLLEYKKVEVENGDDRTRYYYDETGNRVRKITMRTSEKDPIDPNWDAPGDDPYWTVVRDIRYIRDVAGNEIALYSGTELEQWNVWGTGNEGKIDSTDNKFFYMKDHLGSVRAVIDTSNTVVSGNDYDIWGYQMDGRSYTSEETDYKFTGKERDKESNYDYFGARYYDSRIGRWGGVDPLKDNMVGYSPYQYGNLNPVAFIDPDGRDAVYIWYSDYEIGSSGYGVPYLGHAGVLLINNETGYTTYYDYGRYDEEGKGEVRSFFDITGENLPEVKFDENGNPTEESINAVLGKISKSISEVQGEQKIEGVYVKSEKFHDMLDYSVGKFLESNKEFSEYNSQREEYNLMKNNCAHFAKNTILQDKNVKYSESMFSSENYTPRTILKNFYREGHRKVTYDPQSNKTSFSNPEKK